MRNVLLIWDFDDTLVRTIESYKRTNTECAKAIVDAFQHQISIHDVMDTQNRIDLELVKRQGFATDRYTESWHKTYTHYCAKYRKTVNKDVLKQIDNEIHYLIHVEIPITINGARKVLESLSNDGYQMIILTAGVELVQRRKIKDVDMEKYFSKIHVSLKKNKETLSEILKSYKWEHAFMIGNSLASDIQPAIENDIWGLHIPRDTWGADEYPVNTKHPRYLAADSIKDVPKLLKQIVKESTPV